MTDIQTIATSLAASGVAVAYDHTPEQVSYAHKGHIGFVIADDGGYLLNDLYQGHGIELWLPDKSDVIEEVTLWQ